QVDFAYEVSLALKAWEGALLVVDAAQGVEAQTISTLYQAIEQDLEIVPVLNKIDLPGADPEGVGQQIVDLIGCKHEEILEVSGKRSEEHTSELQSRFDLVCRLLLEKKKKKQRMHSTKYTQDLIRREA